MADTATPFPAREGTDDLPFVRAALSQAQAAPSGAGWLDILRADGLAAFRAHGLPGRRTEAWKYTSVADLKTAPFVPAGAVSLDSVPTSKALGLSGHRIVLVNGRLVPGLSDADAPEGVDIRSLADVLESTPELLEGRLGQAMPVDGYPFAALNTAVLADGLMIRVRRGMEVGTPLHIVSVAAAGEEPAIFHPRLFVEMGEGAVATLVESHIGMAGPATFANRVSEIVLEDGARLAHTVFQNEEREAVSLAAVQVRLGAGSRYDGFRLSFGGRLARADLRVDFTGPDAEARLNGAYAAGEGQHLDTTSVVDHAVPRCRSENYYKGVLDGSGRGVFQGKIHVAPAAQETRGQQLHKALLLSREAEVDTKPELKIYADDVQCGHGAAAGALDEDALFYLQARGIAPDQARALLIEGFLDDVIEGVEAAPLREVLLERVHAWLEEMHAGQPAMTGERQ